MRNKRNASATPFEAAHSRRTFLTALAAAGASALIPGSGLLGQATSSSVRPLTGRVDIHHHIFPPFYAKAREAEMRAEGFNPRPWTPQTSIDMMDKHNVATAFFSTFFI